MNNDTVDTFIKTYTSSREKYTDFTRSISQILEQILKTQNFRYQTIQHRTKDISSLRDKLLKKPNLISSGVYDLAGCRVLFYTEEDIYKFSELLQQELKVIDIKDKRSPDQYNALHVIIQLDERREKLAEYSNFKDLKCEIQLSTPLFHTWAEINHDLFYKRDSQLEAFSQGDFRFLQEKLNEVMYKYLNKANQSISFIDSEFKKLKEGKQILNLDTLKIMSQSDSNTEIHQYLDKLNYFSSYYRLPEDFEFLPLLEQIWKKSQENDVRLKTSDSQKIVAASFKIIRNVRYWDYEKIIKLCIEKYSDVLFQKQCLETLKDFAKYDLNVVNVMGYAPQKILIEYIPKLDINDAIVKETLISICNSLLNNTIEGNTQKEFNTFTFVMGPIPINEHLKEIRSDAIKLLFRLLENETEVNLSEKIIDALFNSARPIHTEKTTEEHTALIQSNITSILSFLNEKYDKLKNYSKIKIEKELDFYKRRYGSITELEVIKTKLSDDASYVKYKTFVGYDFDYGHDYKQIEAERKIRIDEYIKQITITNLEEWKNYLINDILKESPAGSRIGYPNVHYFLGVLATKKPNEAQKLLNASDLSKFKVSLLIGLLESNNKNEINADIEKKIDNADSLAEIALAYFSIKEIDETIVRKLTAKILQVGDVFTLLTLLRMLCKHHPTKNLKQLILTVIDKLTEFSFYEWPQEISYLSEKLTGDLSIQEYEIILKNLVLKEDIDYDSEFILLALAKKDPKRIIQLFYDRTKKEIADKKLSGAIPFEFHLLDAELKKHAPVVVKEVLNWFKNNDWKFNWEASHLLSRIFPKIEGEFQIELIELLRSKDMNNLDVVLWILDKYEGGPDVLELVKVIIQNFNITSKLRSELFRLVSNTGVVSGEYGFVNAYQDKIGSINAWVSSTDKNISEFAKEYIEYLQNRIKFENLRVEQRVDLMKNQFERSKSL
ncbi:RelA/SpoT domain-containing protein [Candidatus Micrarchaeota archaeon]|nr:RelA/SpoT domain-containing protein [Candidatus Micrarchaeota archaeon]